jgi:hypothetical protein
MDERRISEGDAAQTRIIVEQALDAAVTRLMPGAAKVPTRAPPEAPPLVKWLVGAIASLGALSMIGMAFWLVSSVSTMRETLARMDERQISSASSLADRFQTIDERLGRLEGMKDKAR